jgi:hypothetical protein
MLGGFTGTPYIGDVALRSTLSSEFVGVSPVILAPGRFAEAVIAREGVVAQLRSLRALPDGWDGPSSWAIRDAPVRSYVALIQKLGQDLLQEAEPMATPDGGLRMEWERGPYSYVAELQGDGGMYLCVLGPTASEDHDAEFAAAEVSKLVRFFEDGTIAD